MGPIVRVRTVWSVLKRSICPFPLSLCEPFLRAAACLWANSLVPSLRLAAFE